MEGDLMKEIPLTRGMVAKVDDCDFDELNKFTWQCSLAKTTMYARRSYRDRGYKRQPVVYMHRQILKSGVGDVTDHIDGDGLNNTRENLRTGTYAANNRNLHKKTRGCKYQGVTVDHKRITKYLAGITVDGKYHHLGRYKDEFTAFKTYVVAVVVFGAI